uniref:NAD(P)/FAD-dependent oxidoreductase n=1 Tax=Mycobacterium sp. TaxID=1785 RepID=UPI0031DDC575
GAGIGGLSAIHELKQHQSLGNDDLDVTLIDNDFTHFIGFTLPWIMRGWTTPQQASITPSQQFLRGVHTITGTVTAIDSQSKTVTGDNFETSYDALIVALGAKNNPSAIPGLGQAAAAGMAHHCYSIQDAAHAHRALAAFAGGKIVVLVPSLPFRCPPAPYEVAMLIADYLTEHGRRQNTQIEIFTCEPRPMPGAGPSPGPQVQAFLSEAGIGFHPNMGCGGVDVANKKIDFADGAFADFDLLFFIPPHQPSLSIDGEQNWIAVDPQTLATKKDGIWAIGDVATITTPSGAPVPKAAIMAKGQARTAVHNVLHYLDLAPADTIFDGHAYCIVDTGGHKAARGIGDFYALPAPAVELGQPTTGLHELKKQEERDWNDLLA